MEGHKLLLACSLFLLSLLEVNGKSETTDAKIMLTPITHWDKNKPIGVYVNFIPQVPIEKLKFIPKESRVANITFSVSKKDTEHLSISMLSTDPVPVEPTGSVLIEYEGSFMMNVSVDFDDSVLTEDLFATFSCTSNISEVCDGIEKSMVIVHSVQNLTVSATPNIIAAEKVGSVDVTVNFVKDLETFSPLKLSVTFAQKDVCLVTLDPDADSKASVTYKDISWGEYELSVACSEDCSSLKDHIILPKLTVSAHPPWSQLGNLFANQARNILNQTHVISSLTSTVKSLEKELDNLKNMNTSSDTPSTNTTAINPTTCSDDATTTVVIEPSVTSANKFNVSSPTSSSEPSSSSSSPTPEVSPSPSKSASKFKDDTDPPSEADTTTESVVSSYLSTEYMKWSVVVLIAMLACALLGFLGYQYRLMIKEWVCSKKDVVSSHIPLSLRRSPGGGGKANKYTRLPRTMQEALHQD